MTLSTERFAIYFAPDPTSDVWSVGSSWLGRDPATGHATSRPSGLALADKRAEQLTAKAASYGFHGTLVAPFELHENRTLEELEFALAAFAEERSAFALPCQVSSLGAFLALCPTEPSRALLELHTDLVKDFNEFRAPLNDADVERRSKGGRLTDGQLQHLKEWGYPYVFEDFRFHMTLTNGILDPAERNEVLALLTGLFQDAISQPLAVDRLALFHQSSRSEPFIIKRWFSFAAG
ncbi:MAG: DUF1045 domain-containing protein [Parvularculaceae bacterium]|nr:DUF1045 domain-containing protein [Parvularculaceae bacterium]